MAGDGRDAINAEYRHTPTLLRAMDALVENAVAIEEALACQFRPLVDQILSVVFFDRTTVRIHGNAGSKMTSAPMV